VHRDTLETRGGRPEAQLAQRLSAMLLAMADARVVLVKLADRLQHMRGMTALSAGAAAAAAGEALDVFAPLANRLGVWSIKAELEDLAFQARAPHPLHRNLLPRERNSSTEAVASSLVGLRLRATCLQPQLPACCRFARCSLCCCVGSCARKRAVLRCC